MLNPSQILSALFIFVFLIVTCTAIEPKGRGIWIYDLAVKIVETEEGTFALEDVEFYINIPDRSAHFVCELDKVDSPLDGEGNRKKGTCDPNGANSPLGELAFETTHHPTLVEREEEDADGVTRREMRPYGALSMILTYSNDDGEEVSSTFIALPGDYLRAYHQTFKAYYFFTPLVPRNLDLQFAEL